jgi:uncharacterized protein YuzB (UPF0349 family)
VEATDVVNVTCVVFCATSSASPFSSAAFCDVCSKSYEFLLDCEFVFREVARRRWTVSRFAMAIQSLG